SHQPYPDEAMQRSLLQPALIVLSARTDEQLHMQAQQLLAWVQEEEYAKEPVEQGQDQSRVLYNLAYTLQVGREAMEERLALQVSSLAELAEKLHRYVEGEHEEGDWYRGQVKPYDPMGAFATDEDGQKTITAWMSKGKYEKLLAWWVKGLTVDWRHLYGENLPCRISLPTYPFARERYWIPTPKTDKTNESEKASRAGTVVTVSGAHPAPTNRVALRSLTDSSVLSRRGRDASLGSSLQSLPTDAREADQPKPSISLSRSAQSFSQSRSSDEVKAGTGSPAEPRTQATMMNTQTALSVPLLEEELARSLAQALYMEQRDIDVEI